MIKRIIELQIGDVVTFDGETWELTEATVDRVNPLRCWVRFESLENPEHGDIFEAWPIDREVTFVRHA